MKKSDSEIKYEEFKGQQFISSDDPAIFKDNVIRFPSETLELVRNTSNAIKSDPALMSICCLNDFQCFPLISEALREDGDFILTILDNPQFKTGQCKEMQVLADNYTNKLAFNEDFHIRLFNINPSFYTDFPKNIRDNNVKLAVSVVNSNAYDDACAWKALSENIKGRSEVLLAFYKRNALYTYEKVFNRDKELTSLLGLLDKEDESVFVKSLIDMNLNKWDGDKRNAWYAYDEFRFIIDHAIEHVSRKSLERLYPIVINKYLASRIDDRFKFLDILAVKQKCNPKTIKKQRKSGLI